MFTVYEDINSQVRSKFGLQVLIGVIIPTSYARARPHGVCIILVHLRTLDASSSAHAKVDKKLHHIWF